MACEQPFLSLVPFPMENIKNLECEARPINYSSASSWLFIIIIIILNYLSKEKSNFIEENEITVQGYTGKANKISPNKN